MTWGIKPEDDRSALDLGEEAKRREEASKKQELKQKKEEDHDIEELKKHEHTVNSK